MNPLNTMKITAQMIALNEASVLPDALKSLKGFADEIVIVDGGSTDDTVKIAKQFGAIVVNHPWSNHFADSRNAAIRVTTGNWVLIMDCDESLEPGSGELLKQCARDGRYEAYIIKRIQTTPQGMQYETLIPRFGKMGAGKHFVYRVHEQLRPEIHEFGMTQARIRHRPCPVERRRTKLEHYLKLLDLEIAENPGQDRVYHRIERIQTRRELGYPRWHDGLAEILRTMDFRRPTAPSGQPNILIEASFLAPAEALPSGMRHLHLVEIVDRWFPNNCVLNGLAAWRLYEAGQFQECLRHGERAMNLYQSGTYDRSHGFNPAFLSKQLAPTLEDAKARLLKQRVNVDFSKIVPPKP